MLGALLRLVGNSLELWASHIFHHNYDYNYNNDYN